MKPYYIVSAVGLAYFNVCSTKHEADQERLKFKRYNITRTYIKKKKGDTALSDYR